ALSSFHATSAAAISTLSLTTLFRSLLELVKIRASQINGCANCLHMHTADARKAGEREERIYLLDAWHESLLYTPRERAALAWTRSEEHTSELQSRENLVCRLLLEKK